MHKVKEKEVEFQIKKMTSLIKLKKSWIKENSF